MDEKIVPEDFIAAVDEAKRTLGCMSDLGCHGLECSKESLDRLSMWGKPRSRNAPPQASTLKGLDLIRADLGDCRRCALSFQRTHLVFGEGHDKARLMFIGDTPGGDDDIEGRPFAGPSGQLLTKMIEAMGLGRQDVYITTIMKCHPKQSKHPLPEEVRACFPYVKQQIQAVNPEVICTLGAFATQVLLGKTESVAGLRGCFHALGPYRVMPTFHPSFLLQKPEHKREAWADLKKVMEVLGLKRP